MKIVNDQLLSNPDRQGDFFDEHESLNTVATTGKWTNTKDGTATLALGVAGESTVVLTTAATDNNENYLFSNSRWDILASRPLLGECRVQYAEAATDDANAVIGFMSGWAADHLVDNGAGLVASFSGAVFYKVDGGTKWKVSCSVGATRYGDNTTNVTAGGAAFASFRIEVHILSATEAEIVYLIDTAGGSDYHQCRDNTTGLPIKHIITYTSFAAAAWGYGIKAGGATDETFIIDRSRVSQLKG